VIKFGHLEQRNIKTTEQLVLQVKRPATANGCKKEQKTISDYLMSDVLIFESSNFQIFES